MEKIWNTVAHNPNNGLYGDCHRVCYAMNLGLTPSEVPHFYEDGEASAEIGSELQTVFLASRGLVRANIPYPGEMSVEHLLAALSLACPGVPMILSGTSNGNCGHSVVTIDGEIHHDPSGSGIVGPCLEDGFYWLTIFSPKAPT